VSLATESAQQAGQRVGLPDASELLAIAVRIAEEIAGPSSDDVDSAARFPIEAIGALKAHGLLGALIPTELGGLGASFAQTAEIVETLGKSCASTAMIFAMHQIQVASIIRHGRSPALRAMLTEVAESQLLLGSATTEAGIGGDVRSSICAVDRDDDSFSLEKNAPVISYGKFADGILATARRSVDSAPGDQLLVVCRRPGLSLEPTSVWDTLGFRGTCSPGFLLTAHGPATMILDDPYAEISSRTMLPASHIFWASAWLGIATAAVTKARAFVRKAARSKPGTTPPGATRLAELMVIHQQFAELVHAAARRFDEDGDDPQVTSSLGFAIAMNSLKVSASTLVVDIVGKAMLICGIAGYREDSPYRLGRLLRDSYGAALMVNNDRIIGNNAQLLLVHKD
jgi:acyl-CoA dehydrogenase